MNGGRGQAIRSKRAEPTSVLLPSRMATVTYAEAAMCEEREFCEWLDAVHRPELDAILGVAPAHGPTLLELPPELLELVANALLCDDPHPQADAQAVCRLATSSKALRQQLVRGSDAVVAELQAARKMLTLQRQHELNVAAGRLGADAAFDPSEYKQVAQQLPAPETTLDLAHCQWRVAAGGERGRVVARLLRASGSLVELYLTSNSIGDEGAKAIAEALKSSGSLVELRLWGNQIGDEGAKALAAGVAASGSLAVLLLGGCGIGDEGAKALAAGIASSGSMATLYLGGNSIGDVGAKALAEAVKSSGSLALKTLYVEDKLLKHAELVAACKSKGVRLV